MKQKITPFLWFDSQAEEAVEFYLSVFKNSKKGPLTYYEQEGEKVSGMPAGSVMTVDFQLEGQHFTAINGGPVFKFNEAVSFVIDCQDQSEVDYYWEKLSEGGDEKAQQCGWLKDKFGLSWQVVPQQLTELLTDSDQKKVSRVMAAMLKMKKLDIKILQNA